MRIFFSKHGDFMKNVAILMSGKSLAAIIALVTMPIVASLFTPADFGAAAIFVSAVGMLSTVATLRYGRAIILPESDATATNILGFAHRVAIAYCGAVYFIIFALDLMDVTPVTLELLGNWKWAIPVGIWLTAVVGIQEGWLTRQKGFAKISRTLVVGNLTSSGVRIGNGLAYGTSVSGLIVGDLCGRLGRLLMQLREHRLVMSATVSKESVHESRSIARHYSDFPLFNAPAGFVFSLGQNLPVLLFGTMFGPAVAGFYAMSHRLSRAPMSLVATSMRRVFLQKVASITNQNRSLMKAFSLSLIGLALVGFLPFITLYLFGQEILGWLLGDEWIEAGRFLEITAPWLLSIWISVPCNPIFVVLRRQKLWLIMTSTLTVLRLAAFGIASLLDSDPAKTLHLFVLATIFGHSITIVVAYSLIRATTHGTGDFTSDPDTLSVESDS